MIFLFGILSAVVVAMWYYFRKDRDARDKIRDDWHADTRKERDAFEGRLREIEKEIAVSNEKHKSCETDRETLRDTVKDLRERVQRFEKCSSGDKCPMRLP